MSAGPFPRFRHVTEVDWPRDSDGGQATTGTTPTNADA